MKKLMFAITTTAIFSAASAMAAKQDEERDRFHAAFGECAAQLGIALPEKGKKPEKLAADKKADLDSCLERQGVTLPPPLEHRDHEAMRACVEASGVNVPPPPHPGEARLELTEEQKAVVEKCHNQVAN